MTFIIQSGGEAVDWLNDHPGEVLVTSGSLDIQYRKTPFVGIEERRPHIRTGFTPWSLANGGAILFRHGSLLTPLLTEVDAAEQDTKRWKEVEEALLKMPPKEAQLAIARTLLVIGSK